MVVLVYLRRSFDIDVESRRLEWTERVRRNSAGVSVMEQARGLVRFFVTWLFGACDHVLPAVVVSNLTTGERKSEHLYNSTPFPEELYTVTKA